MSLFVLQAQRNKADHIWTLSSEIYLTQSSRELYKKNPPKFPQSFSAQQLQQHHSRPTSVVDDDTKVCRRFVLCSFGGQRDNGRLGRILDDGGDLLWGRKRKGSKENKAQQVFRAISSTKSIWNSSGCWLWNLKCPPGFRSCSGFIREGLRFPLNNAAVTLSCCLDECLNVCLI